MKRPSLKISLIWKIMAIIILVVGFFGAVVMIFLNNNLTTYLVDSKRETIELASKQQAEEVMLIVQELRRATDAIPGIQGIADYLEDQNRVVQDKQILKSLVDFGAGRQVLSVYLLDSHGKSVLSTDPSFLNIDFSYRKYFSSAIKGEPSTEMLIGSVTKEPGLFFSTPVKNKSGEIVGVAVVKMNMQPVYETLIDSYIGSLGKFMLVNDDGVIIYTNKEGSIYKSLGKMSDSLKGEIVKENRYLGKEILFLDYDTAQSLVESQSVNAPTYEFYDEVDKENELIDVHRVGDSPLYLVSEVSSSSVTDVVSQLTNSILLVILLALVFGTIIEALFVRRLLGPLSKMNRYAVSVSAGNLNETISVRTGDELETVTDSIKQMVATLKSLNMSLEGKVAEKTAELEKTLKDIEAKNMDLENTKKAVLNVMEDLNEEKDHLFFEKNRIETILKSIGDGVFVTDNEGKIIMINKAAERMSGYRLIDGEGKYYTSIFKFGIEGHPEIKYRDFVKEVLDSGNQVSLEKHSVLIGKEGTEIPVLDSAAPVKDIEGKTYGCVTVFRDNTRERELEKSKDDFLSVTSHQLRTPLGSMRWNVEMLLAGDAGKLPDEAHEVAQQIHEGNIRMIDLVNDLLNVNRIDQGRVLDEPVKTDIAKVIREATAELDVEAMERRVKVRMNLKPVEKVIIDPKRLREVVMNLVSNAVKYNNAGGWVKVSLATDKQMNVITVEDNGVGIPKKDLQNMFKKFFRASNAVHSETEGSGLGLYVVKKFVEGWGGKITLESKEGKGSKFTIYLPLKIAKLHTDE